MTQLMHFFPELLNLTFEVIRYLILTSIFIYFSTLHNIFLILIQEFFRASYFFLEYLLWQIQVEYGRYVMNSLFKIFFSSYKFTIHDFDPALQLVYIAKVYKIWEN